MAKPKPATPKQLRYLRSLAEQTGTTFSPPQSSAEASRAIEQLRSRARSPRHERRADRDALSGGVADAAAMRGDEVSGHGSSARWRGREEGR